MKKQSTLKQYVIPIFITLAALQSIANNMVHPVTPAFIQHLQLHDYMFGVAYASMNVMMFISSFYWADASNKMKMDRIFVIALVGYAISQLVFMLSKTEIQIIVARLMAGAFSGGFLVGQMNFLVDHSPDEERGSNLTTYSIAMIVASTAGYFLGGLAGDVSVYLPFIIQIITLLILALIMKIFLSINSKPVIHQEKKRISPVESIKHSWSILDYLGRIMFFSIFFIGMSNVIFDNSFNYYLKDVLQMPPSMNGILKAIIGVFTLISNLTLTFYLIRKTKISRSMLIILMLVVLWLSLILLGQDLWVFIGISLLILASFSIIGPLQQQTVSMMSNEQESIHHLMGLFNATKALGGILGALSAGFIYEYFVFGPFVLTIICVLIAITGLIRYERLSR